jgi:translation elongation factor EF-Tu-like GTPase
MELINKKKLRQTVQQIIRNVDELYGYYMESTPFVRSKIVQHLEESYLYECNQTKRIVPIDQFIQEIEKSIGWEFVMPDEELI